MKLRCLMLCLLVPLTVLAGCADSPGESAVVIAQRLTFGARTGESVDGRDVSFGVDLDGVDTRMREAGTCFVRDYVSPDGRPGIDNAFAQLFDLVESFFQAGTLEGIVQGTINEGRLLMLFELQGVDDWSNDDEVQLTIFLGDGRPAIGGDDRIVSGQTFDRRDTEEFVVRGRIQDGVLETDTFDLSLPMAFFNVFFDLHLHDARMRAIVSPTGEWTGVVAGGMDNEDIVDLARQADMMQEIQITPTLEMLLPSWADLSYNPETRTCDRLSATLLFHSTQAFVFADSDSE